MIATTKKNRLFSALLAASLFITMPAANFLNLPTAKLPNTSTVEAKSTVIKKLEYQPYRLILSGKFPKTLSNPKIASWPSDVKGTPTMVTTLTMYGDISDKQSLKQQLTLLKNKHPEVVRLSAYPTQSGQFKVIIEVKQPESLTNQSQQKLSPVFSQDSGKQFSLWLAGSNNAKVISQPEDKQEKQNKPADNRPQLALQVQDKAPVKQTPTEPKKTNLSTVKPDTVEPLNIPTVKKASKNTNPLTNTTRIELTGQSNNNLTTEHLNEIITALRSENKALKANLQTVKRQKNTPKAGKKEKELSKKEPRLKKSDQQKQDALSKENKHLEKQLAHINKELLKTQAEKNKALAKIEEAKKATTKSSANKSGQKQPEPAKTSKKELKQLEQIKNLQAKLVQEKARYEKQLTSNKKLTMTMSSLSEENKLLKGSLSQAEKTVEQVKTLANRVLKETEKELLEKDKAHAVKGAQLKQQLKAQADKELASQLKTAQKNWEKQQRKNLDQELEKTLEKKLTQEKAKWQNEVKADIETEAKQKSAKQQAEADQLKQQLNKLTDQNKSLEQKNTELKSSVKVLNEEKQAFIIKEHYLKAAKKKEASLSSENEKLKAEIKTVRQVLEKTQKELITHQSERDNKLKKSYTRQIKTLSSEKEVLNQKLAEKTAELDKVQAKNTQYLETQKQSIQELTRKNTSLKTKLLAYEKNLATLKRKQQEKEAAAKNSPKSISKNNKHATKAFEKDLRKAEEKINKTKLALEKVQTEKTALQTRFDILQEQFKALESHTEATMAANLDLEEKLQTAKANIEKVNKGKSRFSLPFGGKNNETLNYKESVSVIQELKAVKQERDFFEKEVSKMKQKLAKLEHDYEVPEFTPHSTAPKPEVELVSNEELKTLLATLANQLKQTQAELASMKGGNTTGNNMASIYNSSNNTLPTSTSTERDERYAAMAIETSTTAKLMDANMNQGDPEQVLLTLMKDNPHKPNIYLKLKEIYIEEKNYPQAEWVLQSLLRYNPEYHATHYELARLYTLWQQPEKARESLLTYKKFKPGDGNITTLERHLNQIK